MKLQFVLKPCPWCKCTPHISMPINEETWRFNVYCQNQLCSVKPQSMKYYSFRKTTKTDFNRFLDKFSDMVFNWNKCNETRATDLMTVDLSTIEDKFTNIMAAIYLKEDWMTVLK